jgi:hypothetical protein
LISGPAEFEEITAIIRQGLEEAWRHIKSGNLEVEEPGTRGMPAATA